MKKKINLTGILMGMALASSPLTSESQERTSMSQLEQKKVPYEEFNEKWNIQRNNYQEILNRTGAEDTSQLLMLPGGYVSSKEIGRKIMGLAQINEGNYGLSKKGDGSYSIKIPQNRELPKEKDIKEVLEMADKENAAGYRDKAIHPTEYTSLKRKIYEKNTE